MSSDPDDPRRTLPRDARLPADVGAHTTNVRDGAPSALPSGDWDEETRLDDDEPSHPPPSDPHPPFGDATAFGPADEPQTHVWQGAGPHRLRRHTGPQEVVIGERYRVIDRLGEGGTARIVKVEHLGLGKEFALKLLPEEWSQGPRMQERLFREAQMASRLDHPSIVQITDFGVDDAHGAYIVMEYLKGETLRAHLALDLEPLPIDRAIEIALQIADGLTAMHRAGIVHCDVKPDNVFLCRSPLPDDPDLVKLIDFGLARAQVEAAQLARSEVGGTPQYIAPEQSLGVAPQPSMDIYALGVVLYEMVAGRPPFAGSARQLLQAHRTAAPPSPSAQRGEPLDPALEAFVLALLAKDPGDRPATMAQVAQGLRGIRGDSLPGGRATDEELGEVPRGAFSLAADPDAAGLRAIFALCPCPLFRLDARGVVRLANRAFGHFVGARPADVVGRPVGETRLGQACPDLARDLLVCARDGIRTPVVKIVSFQKGADAQVSVQIQVVPEFDAGGQITHFVGIVHSLGAA